ASASRNFRTICSGLCRVLRFVVIVKVSLPIGLKTFITTGSVFQQQANAPWYFQVNGGKPFAFAGIWERWDKGDKPLESCAILTTTPNELMAPIHDRLPVILSPTDYDAWLDSTMNDPEKLTYLYEPFPASEMSKYRVSAYVNKVGNKGKACMEPLTQ
ncbi:MAG TPA: SOS response-associated peptidase family protein, partial [Pirellulales bacterium]|nr:SOS response-associated peptidase family protein [Pirellulales bacterium]